MSTPIAEAAQEVVLVVGHVDPDQRGGLLSQELAKQAQARERGDGIAEQWCSAAKADCNRRSS